jgi:hypothetical protein
MQISNKRQDSNNRKGNPNNAEQLGIGPLCEWEQESHDHEEHHGDYQTLVVHESICCSSSWCVTLKIHKATPLRALILQAGGVRVNGVLQLRMLSQAFDKGIHQRALHLLRKPFFGVLRRTPFADHEARCSRFLRERLLEVLLCALDQITALLAISGFVALAGFADFLEADLQPLPALIAARRFHSRLNQLDKLIKLPCQGRLCLGRELGARHDNEAEDVSSPAF